MGKVHSEQSRLTKEQIELAKHIPPHEAERIAQSLQRLFDLALFNFPEITFEEQHQEMFYDVKCLIDKIKVI